MSRPVEAVLVGPVDEGLFPVEEDHLQSDGLVLPLLQKGSHNSGQVQQHCTRHGTVRSRDHCLIGEDLGVEVAGQDQIFRRAAIQRDYQIVEVLLAEGRLVRKRIPFRRPSEGHEEVVYVFPYLIWANRDSTPSYLFVLRGVHDPRHQKGLERVLEAASIPEGAAQVEDRILGYFGQPLGTFLAETDGKNGRQQEQRQHKMGKSRFAM